MTKSHIAIGIIVCIIAFILGRLAVRIFLNFLLGGTMFGGNLL